MLSNAFPQRIILLNFRPAIEPNWRIYIRSLRKWYFLFVRKNRRNFFFVGTIAIFHLFLFSFSFYISRYDAGSNKKWWRNGAAAGGGRLTTSKAAKSVCSFSARDATEIKCDKGMSIIEFVVALSYIGTGGSGSSRSRRYPQHRRQKQWVGTTRHIRC